MDYHPALLAEEGDDDSDDEVAAGGLTPEDLLMRVEEEELDGPEDDDQTSPLTPVQASQLLVLLSHARTCPGLHKSERHSSVCRALKYLMLHIRDCDGKVRKVVKTRQNVHTNYFMPLRNHRQTLDGELCKFTWCRPSKQLVTHLTRCYEPEKCTVCNPK